MIHVSTGLKIIIDDANGLFSRKWVNFLKQVLENKVKEDIYLNSKETQPFEIHLFFHMDYMRIIS